MSPLSKIHVDEEVQMRALLALMLTAAFLLPNYAFAQLVGFSINADLDLRKGINFGNMLDAPYEGAWGLVVEERFFDKTVEGGFTHIRLPVSWTHYADTQPPYTIDNAIFERVDWAIEQAKLRGLKIIVNNHHYDEFQSDPVNEEPRALAIWSQIAERYQRQRRFLIFEILIEPHNVFNEQPQLWNLHVVNALDVIRQSNPTRKVIVGPVEWNSIDRLDELELPDDDNLIVTIHYYRPLEFTHQGAPWMNPPLPTGEPWIEERYAMSDYWQNWSWNTEIGKSLDGLLVQYQAGWAGLRFHSINPPMGVTQLKFNFDVATTLRIQLENEDFSGFVDLQTQSGSREYTVDIDFLGPHQTVTDVTFMNLTPNAVPVARMSKAELISADEVTKLVVTEKENVQFAFDRAHRWRTENQHPIYLGEFGAFEEADMASRVRFTRTVREEARRRRFGWAYWELASGFGIFDPLANQWREPLLEALIPD